ncbi:MAG: EcsC family protein [Clostridiales bacterium]|nr:EcsC family protein [Clostridiales bacterium]
MDKKQEKALRKEWQRLKRQEDRFLFNRISKKDTKLNRLLDDKVPSKLQHTLDAAFAKAFSMVFEQGTGIIEKTYNKKKINNKFMINDFADGVQRNRKSLKRFSKKANGSHAVNVAISGASGVGLGILGIGIPDIPLFTAGLLKGIYQMTLHYGYQYETEEERYFILLLIRGSVSYGNDLQKIDEQINEFIETGNLPDDYQRQDYIKKAANSLSKELLYMKFLQGIPIVGAVGGAYDAIYMQQVLKYAGFKYRRRFYLDRK